MKRFLALISLLLISSTASCYSNVAASGSPSATRPTFCFDFKFKFNSQDTQSGQVCFHYNHVCQHVLEKTKQYGSMAGVTGLIECGMIK